MESDLEAKDHMDIWRAAGFISNILCLSRGPERSFVVVVIGLIELVLGFVSSIGVSYLAYRFLLGQPATIMETLSAIWRFAGRVIGSSCLVFLILSPCFFLTLVISIDLETQPPQLSDRAVLLGIFISLLSGLLEFSTFGFFANDLGIRQTLKDAWALFTSHFRILVTLGLIMTALIYIYSSVAGILTMLIQSGFDITSLSRFNFIFPATSVGDNPLFLLINGISQIIFPPFNAFVCGLAYLKYSKLQHRSMLANST